MVPAPFSSSLIMVTVLMTGAAFALWRAWTRRGGHLARVCHFNASRHDHRVRTVSTHTSGGLELNLRATPCSRMMRSCRKVSSLLLGRRCPCGTSRRNTKRTTKNVKACGASQDITTILGTDELDAVMASGKHAPVRQYAAVSRQFKRARRQSSWQGSCCGAASYQDGISLCHDHPVR